MTRSRGSRTRRPGVRDRAARGVQLKIAGVLVVLSLTVLSAGAFYVRLLAENRLKDLRMETALAVVEVREEIEFAIFQQVVSLERLAGYIRRHPDLTREEFADFTSGLAENVPEFLDIVAAPNFVARFSTGSEVAEGLDYRKSGETGGPLGDLPEGGSGRIVAPIDLQDGSKGAMIRLPVYLSATGKPGSGALWGMVSAVIDQDLLLARTDIPEISGAYDLVLFNGPPSDPATLPIFGDPAVAQRSPVQVKFDFSYGTWYIVATPAGGWPRYPGNYGFQLTLISAVGILFMLSFVRVLLLSEARRRAETRLSHAIEALDSGFAMFDHDRRLVVHNSKYLELYGDHGRRLRNGASIEELAGAGAPVGASGEDEQIFDDMTLLADGRASQLLLVSVDGEPHYIQCGRQETGSGDIVLSRTDVTELYLAKQRAEEADRAKTEFLNTLSHELRTPLTVIFGISRIYENVERLEAARKLYDAVKALPQDAAQTVRDKLDRFFEEISRSMGIQARSGSHLMYLINEMLDLAKIEAGALSVHMEPCSTQRIVGTVAEQMQGEAEKKGLRLEVACAEETVLADEGRTRQILINLLGNAIKFTETGTISLMVERSGDFIRFMVRDTGIGMSPSDQKEIFKPFLQLDSSDKRAQGGTGLGLAISRELAHAQGGTLDVDSKPGVGSTFTLMLQAEARQSKAA